MGVKGWTSSMCLWTLAVVMWAMVSPGLCNTSFMSIDAFSNLSKKPIGPYFCQDTLSFPNEKEQLLDTKEKRDKMKTALGRGLGDLVDKIATNTKVFDVTKHTPQDLRIALSAMGMAMFSNAGGDTTHDPLAMFQWLSSDMSSAKDKQKLKAFIKSSPYILMLLKRPIVEEVFMNTTEEEFAEFCMKLLSPSLPISSLAVVLRHYPECAVSIYRSAPGSEKKNYPQQNDDIVFQRLRDVMPSYGVGLLRISPTDITMADMNHFRQNPMNSTEMKFLGEIATKLRPEVREEFGKILAERFKSVSNWIEKEKSQMGDLLTFLPPSELEKYFSEEKLEQALTDGTLLHEDVVWFMAQNLPEKRNSTNFNKRFCLSLLYFTDFVTTTVLDKFSPSELSNAFKECGSIFSTVLADPKGFQYFAAGSEPFLSDYSIQGETINMLKFNSYMLNKLSQIQPVLEKIFSDKTAATPLTSLSAMAMFLPFVPPHVFANLNADVLYSAWPQFSNYGSAFSLPKLEIIYNKIKAKFPAPENMQPNDVKNLGSLLLVLPCDAIRKIKDDVLIQVVEEGHFNGRGSFRCDGNEEACWLLASKVLKSTDKSKKGNVVSQLGVLAKYVKQEDLGDGIFDNPFFDSRIVEEMYERQLKMKKESKEPSNTWLAQAQAAESMLGPIGEVLKSLLGGAMGGGPNGGGGNGLPNGIGGIPNGGGMPGGGDKNGGSLEDMLGGGQTGGSLADKISGVIDSMLQGGGTGGGNGGKFNDMLDMAAGAMPGQGGREESNMGEDEQMDGPSAPSMLFIPMLTDADIQGLPENAMGLDALINMQYMVKLNMAMRGGQTKPSEMDSTYRYLKKIYKMDSDVKDICVSGAIASRFACAFTRASKSELMKLSLASRKVVLSEEGKRISCVSSMPQQLIRDHFEALLDADAELKNNVTWTSAMVMTRGPALFGGMKKDHAIKLSHEAAVRLGKFLCELPQLDTETRKTIFAKILEHHQGKMDNLFKSPYTVRAAGTCHMFANKTQIAAMNQTSKRLLAGIAGSLLDAMNIRLEALKGDKSRQADAWTEEAAVKELVQGIMDVMTELRILKTNIVYQLKKFSHLLSADFIRGLTNDEFRVAVHHFKDGSNWGDAQKEALKSKLNQTFGDVSTWSRITVLSLRKLLSDTGVNHANVSLDECTMKSLLIDMKSDGAMMESMCNKAGSFNISDLAIQNPRLLCCLKPEQIDALEPSRVVELVRGIEDRCFPCLKENPKQMEKFADKLGTFLTPGIMNNGTDVSNVLKNMKCFAGKLPVRDLMNLPPGLIAHLPVEAVENMAPEAFCGIATPEVVSSMLSDQRLALSDEKIECMGKEALRAFQRSLPLTGGMQDIVNNLPVFNMTEFEVGEAPGFESFKKKLSEPLTEQGSGGAKECVSPKGKGVAGLTGERLQEFKKKLDQKLALILDKIQKRSDMDISQLSSLDMTQILEDLSSLDADTQTKMLNFVQDLPRQLEDMKKETKDFISSTLSQTHPRLYTLFKPTPLCQVLRKLKRNNLMELCHRLSREDISTQTFLSFSENCPVCITLLDTERGQERGNGSMLDEKKCAAFYSLLMRQKDKKLDLHHLTVCPEALTLDVVQAVDTQNFKDIAQLSLLSSPNFYTKVPKPVLRAVLQKIVDALGPMDQWNSLLKARLRFFFFKMPRRELREMLTPEAIIELLTSRASRMDGLVDDPRVRRLVGQLINTYVLKMGQLIPKSVLQMPQVFCLQLSAGLPASLLKEGTTPYDEKFLVDMVAKCPEFYDIPQDVTNKFTRQVTKASNKDVSALKKLKGILGHLTNRDIRMFPKEAWKEMLPELNEEELDDAQLLNIWSRIKDDYPATNLTCRQIESLGRMTKAWPASYIKQIPAKTIKECLPKLAQALTDEDLQNLPKHLSRGLWKKVKDSAGSEGKNVSDLVMGDGFSPELVNIIPRKEMDSMVRDKPMPETREKILKMAGHAKGKDMAKAVKKSLDMSKPEDQRLVMSNEKLAEIVLTFSSGQEIEKLQDGEAMGSMLESLADKVKDMSAKSLEENFNLLKKRIGLDKCKTESLCMDEGQARAQAGLFVAARAPEMKCLTKKTRRVILETIGSQDELCKRMTRTNIRDMLTLAKETGANMTDFGCLVCGHMKAQVDKLTDQEVDDMHPIFSMCSQLDPDTAKAVMDKIIKRYGNLSQVIQKNPDLSPGLLLKYVDPAQIDALQQSEKEVISANLGGFIKMLNEEDEDRMMRVQRGEISKEEEEMVKTKKNKVLGSMYKALISLVGTQKQRRKRQTQENTCSLLEEFGGNLCFLSLQQVNELSDQAVRDCASQFQTCNFSTDILTALATKAKNAMGTTANTWALTDFQELGKLLGMMGAETIGQMPLTDDVMAVLPLDTAVPNGGVLIKRYLTHNNLQLSALGPEHISDYVLMLGALTTEELNQLDPNAVGNAALQEDMGSATLGQLDFVKLQLLVNKLIESNKMNFSQADTSDIQSLGPLAGALPENVLTSLTKEQKQGLTLSAMEIIPGNVFAKAFTAEDIQSFTVEQASALTEGQKSQLSAEQQAALTTKMTVNTDGGRGSGTIPQASLLLLSVLALVPAWIQTFA